MGQRQAGRRQRVEQTRTAIGVVSDIGGAVVTVSMLGAAAFGLAGVVVGLAQDEPGLMLFGGGVVAGVALGGLLIYLTSARAATTIEVERGYRWVTAAYIYEVSAADPHVHTQTVRVEIMAIRDGVRAFSNQYRWSGVGTDRGPVVTSRGHRMSDPRRSNLGWRAYEVSLGPGLRKGERAAIEVRHDLADDAEAFEPYLAKAVHETMDTLTLQVTLPHALEPHVAWRVALDGAGPEARKVEREEAAIGPSRSGQGWTIEWLVSRPVVGLTYALFWEYDHGRGIYDLSPVSDEADTA